MHALTTSHGWGGLMMILAIIGWSALMLLLVYLLTRRRPPRSTPSDTTHPRRHPLPR